MFKTLLFQIALLVALALTTLHAQITTPQPSPSAKVEQTVGLTEVSVAYSRPGMKGRTIFGADGLVPYGELWRTGANKNTVIAFDKDVTVGGQVVAAGEYALFTRPDAAKWEVYFYTDTENWGVPQEWDESKVAATVTAKPIRAEEAMQNFTILFDELDGTTGTMYLGWDRTLLPLKIETATDDEATASIDRVLAGPSARDYYSAATYYHESGKDLDKAYEWIKKANAMEEGFWMVRRQALIEADLGMKQDAIASAKKSKTLAEAAGNADYVRMNDKSIAEWSR